MYVTGDCISGDYLNIDPSPGSVNSIHYAVFTARAFSSRLLFVTDIHMGLGSAWASPCRETYSSAITCSYFIIDTRHSFSFGPFSRPSNVYASFSVALPAAKSLRLDSTHGCLETALIFVVGFVEARAIRDVD